MTISNQLYAELHAMTKTPECWSACTTDILWTDPHISSAMLQMHLDPDSVPASRPHAFIDRSSAWITDRFGLSPGTSVTDFGCGPGLYARRFHNTGADVTGIDFSPRSIEFARRQTATNGRDITYIEGDYLEVPITGPFDLITLIYCDFCALNPDQRRRLLGRFADLLAPGGSVLMDVFSMKAFEGREEGSEIARNFMGGFWSPEEYVAVRQTFRYAEENVVLDRYDVIEESRQWTVYNWLQYFNTDRLAAEFDAAGLEIVEWYGDVTGKAVDNDDDVMAVVARRKA